MEDGTDLTTCAPFISRAPERYGAICTLSTQNTKTYGSSYALKGVFNNKGTYPYQEYQVWTWASLCLEEWYGNAVNLKGKCLTYDVKTENCGLYSSFIVMAPNGQRTPEVSFSLADPTNAYPGITCKALSNGWYRVTIDFTKAYGEHAILLNASEVLIMYSNQDCANRNADSVFYMDNMCLVDAPIVGPTIPDSSDEPTIPDTSEEPIIPETSEEPIIPETSEEESPDDEEIPFEYDDWVSYLPIKSNAPGYGAIATLTYDTEVVSSSDSLVSLKGEFNNKGANTYQGYMVWTWAELCLAEYFEVSVDLNNVLLTYDVKTINCGIYSSFILVASDGTYSKEVSFAFEDPRQTSAGIVSTPCGNGWCTVEIDFSVAYADNPSVLDDVSSILIMFSNQDCEDRNANSIYYIDNMLFESTLEEDEEPTYPDDDELEDFYFPEELDLATSDYVSVTNDGVPCNLTIQEEVISDLLFQSEAALKGTFYSNSIVTTWLVFDVEAFYQQPVPLENSILYFEVMTETCDMLSSLVLQSTDGQRSTEMSFLRDDYEMLNENVLCIDWGNGWTGILINVADAFASDTATIQEVSKLFLSFNNKGYEGNDANSVFYIDNFLFTSLPDEEELEDFATNAPFVSRAPENYGVHNTLTVQSDVVFGNSTAALMGVFNNEGADVHNGYAVWTWAELCLEEFIGTAVSCKDLYLTFNAKVENGKPISSLILVAPDGTRSQEMTFDFNDPSKTYPGITCVALSDGWYQITIDFNRTFSRELYVLDEVSEMLFVFTNENCENPEENTVFYIDNMIFTDVNPNE